MKAIKIILASLVLISTFSCKTTEENYRAAYETAKAGYDKNKLDSDTENKIAAEKYGQEVTVNGRNVKIKTDFVSIVEVAEGESYEIPAYNVVVGSFKQRFNARMQKQRLRNSGVEAFVLVDRNKQFYVIAKGFASPDEAAEYISNSDSHIPFPLPIEPFIFANPAKL